MAAPIDGTPVTSWTASGDNYSATLNTSNATDIIIIAGATNSGSSITGITGAGLTWHQREGYYPSGSGTVWEWYAVATSAISNQTITIATSGANLLAAVMFAIEITNTVLPFDQNSALPHLQSSNTAGTAPPTITTSNANDLLLYITRFSSTSSPTAGTGWTQLLGQSDVLVEYMVVSSTQNALTPLIGTGSGNQTRGISDAITLNSLLVLSVTGRISVRGSVASGATAALAASTRLAARGDTAPHATAAISAHTRLAARGDLRPRAQVPIVTHTRLAVRASLQPRAVIPLIARTRLAIRGTAKAAALAPLHVATRLAVRAVQRITAPAALAVRTRLAVRGQARAGALAGLLIKTRVALRGMLRVWAKPGPLPPPVPVAQRSTTAQPTMRGATAPVTDRTATAPARNRSSTAGPP